MGGNSSKTIIDDVTTIINKSVNKTNNDINNSVKIIKPNKANLLIFLSVCCERKIIINKLNI